MKEVLTDEDIVKIEQLYGVELTTFQKSMFKRFWVFFMNKQKNNECKDISRRQNHRGKHSDVMIVDDFAGDDFKED